MFSRFHKAIFVLNLPIVHCLAGTDYLKNPRSLPASISAFGIFTIKRKNSKRVRVCMDPERNRLCLDKVYTLVIELP